MENQFERNCAMVKLKMKMKKSETIDNTAKRKKNLSSSSVRKGFFFDCDRMASTHHSVLQEIFFSLQIKKNFSESLSAGCVFESKQTVSV